MARPIGKATSGTTLLEVMVSLTLLSVIGGIFFMVTDSASSALRSGVTVAELDGKAQRVLKEVCESLKASSSDRTTPQTVTPFSGTEVDYQRAIGIDAAGDPVWGPIEHLELEAEEAEDGVDNDGDELVDECRLVWTENPGLADERRTVLATGVRSYLEGETFDGTDENGNGLLDERGFCLDFAAGCLTVRLSLEGRDKEGHTIVATLERTVAYRNE
jgi:hypothetical protein